METPNDFTHLKQLHLPPRLFTPDLLGLVHLRWFAGAHSSISPPTPEQLSRWWGANRTPSQKSAFDTALVWDFSESLFALGPSKFPLPPFTTFTEERANAGLMTLPFRRLDVLRKADTEKNKAAAALALVLLLDQISRNCFRKAEEQKLVYAHYDRLARALVYCILNPSLQETLPMTSPGAGLQEEEGGAEEGGGEQLVADLAGIETNPVLVNSVSRRLWLYMPLMHSEDLEDHEAAIAMVNQYRDEVRARGDDDGADYLDQLLQFEERHAVIIRRFGRYPHRNVYLEREPTEEEDKYMAEGGEKFSS